MKTSAREKRLYLLERIGADRRALESVRAVVFHGRAAAAALAAALDRVIAQTGVAALRFEGDESAAAISSGAPLPASIERAAGSAASAALQWYADLPAFDMRDGGLVRAAVIEGPEDVAVVIAAHRAVAGDAALEQWLATVLAGLDLRPAAAPAADPAAEQAAIEHARACLAGLDEAAELTGDRPRPAVQSLRARSRALPCPDAALRAAGALSASLGVSLEAVFAAAFTALLSRYTRKADLVIGRRVPSPTLAGDNDLLLAASLRPGTSVREHIRATHEAIVAAAPHAATPVEAVIDALSPPRDPGRAPLYQIAFSFTERPALPTGWSHLDIPRKGSALDLELHLETTPGAHGAAMTIVETEDLFHDPGRAPRLAAHLAALLEGFAAAPDAPLASLSMVTGAERDALIGAFNALRVFPSEDTLAARVERAARRDPAAVAITCGEERVTYGELEARATRLARRLRSIGVGRDSRVAVLMERSPRLIVALYAILKAGGAYVPIEPSQPRDRIEFVMGDAEPCAALTDGAFEISAPPGVTVLRVDHLEGELAGEPDAPLEPPHCPPGERAADALAYIIYTSGSTGRPKGCLIQNRHVIRLFDATEDHFHFNPSDAWTFFHSVAFDFSVWEIWGALTYGGRVVVVPHTTARSPDDLRRLLAAEAVTVLNQTPSAFRQLIEADLRAAAAGAGPLPALRTVIFGGEALDLESLRPWYSLHGDERPRLVNMYGITETTVHVTYRPLSLADLDLGHASVIGVPIPDLSLYVVDEALELLPIGVPGELLVSGAGVSQGYWKRPELSAERFLPDRFEPSRGRMYRSGDLVKRLPNGELDYLGRIDQQVKIRGYRIELGEVEAAIRKTGLARDAAVVAAARGKGETALIAYVVTESSAADLRGAARALLPDYMVPSVFVPVPVIPMTGNNKVDRRALPDPWAAADAPAAPAEPLRGPFEEAVAAAFLEVTRMPAAGPSFHFFDEGGSSLGAVTAARLIGARLGTSVPVVKLFEHPTVEALARHLEREHDRASRSLRQSLPEPGPERPAGAPSAADPASPAAAADEPIAIIGAAGRFPGASSVHDLWMDLLEGKESVRFFEPGELSPALDPAVTGSPSYVRARGVLEAPFDFDAGFFGMSPREAEITDPQQRIALEVAWEALEAAGHDPARYTGAIGVYAGEYNVTYYTEHLLPRPDVIEKTGAFLAMLGNEKDFIATRIAYKLGLRGPAVSVHTACSTSLVAVTEAFFALRARRCDMALAGGVAITHPTASGHLYQEEGIASPDGHTRPFDADAKGTVFSDGAAFVVMKRLSDAQRDGDNILALIRGAATNNDGAEKMSFMAPTPAGQAEVIAKALSVAGVPASTIGYIEAHGTATPIGDPIEIEGLRRAFGEAGGRGSCGVGSIKSNFGHLAAASGAAGLIKAALSVKEGKIPPTLHFKKPNPRLDIESSPFYIVDRLTPFPRGGAPRRAGVSSFGVGGTNAHVILEEPPPAEPSQPSRRDAQLLLVSGRSPAAAAAAGDRLADRLNEPSDLADAAYTLAVGRRAFSHRRFIVAGDLAEAKKALGAASTPIAARSRPSFAFALSGQGSQYLAMGRELSRREPVFRDELDRCLSLLSSGKNGPGGPLECDLRGVLDPAGRGDDAEFIRTDLVQPAVFAIEWALAKLWLSIGVRPDVLIGHSIGEIVAATLAGVFDLEDALRLIYHRGRLMQAAPRGVMLSVRAAPADYAEDLAAINDPLAAVVVVNSPRLSVAGGPEAAMTALAERLAARGVATSRLRVSHAFHSPMMDSILGEFSRIVAALPLHAPRTPIYSTATGERLTDQQATDPMYWTRHVRETVRFSDALASLWRDDPDRLVIEVGPRSTLATLARQIAPEPKRNVAFASLEVGTPPPDRDPAEGAAFARAVGLAWAHGASIDWEAYYSGERRRRVALPAYPFERQTLVVEPLPFGRRSAGGQAPSLESEKGGAPALAGAPSGAPAQPPSPPMDRRSAFLLAVRAVFEEASGAEITEAGASFMELGLDSLSLTQCAQLLGRRVGGDITFRQLVEGLCSLDAVVDHLLSVLPEDYAPAAPGAAAAPPPAAAPAPAAAPPPVAAPPPDEPGAKKVFGAGARIERTGSALPPEQERALARFMDHYITRTPGSKAYAAAHRDKLADPRVVTGFKPMWKEIVYPIVVERSDGAYLWDIDGNKWLDVTCGFGANFLGHRPPYVTAAVHEQLDRGYEIGPQHPLAGECAALVRELTGMPRVVFCNTGSEAVLGATRLARTITGRPLMVTFTGDYHGILDEVIVRGTKSLRSIPGAPGILPSAVQNNLILDYGERSALDIIRARANDIAAVVVEPVQSRRPDLQPRAFLRELRALTEELGVALVFDEIITGFRLCPGGAQEYFGIKADLATYGKILGGGLPIGAIAGIPRFMDALDGGAWSYGDSSVPEVGVTYFAGTFVRHPLALAACKASLEHIRAEGPELQRRVNQRTAALVASINADFKRAEAPYELTTCSSWFKVSYADDLPFGGLLFFWLRSKGLHIWDGRVAFLTVAHTDEDCAFIREAFASTIREMQAAGFLPQRTRHDPFSVPPVPGARLGKNRDGSPAWFVPDPARPGKYLLYRQPEPA